jgi:ribose transport system permease protein
VGDNWVGGTYTLDSIAAVAIGGTSLAGGRGGVATTIAGVLLLSVLYNLLLLLGVIYFWQEVVKGLIILGGVILYTRSR